MPGRGESICRVFVGPGTSTQWVTRWVWCVTGSVAVTVGGRLLIGHLFGVRRGDAWRCCAQTGYTRFIDTPDPLLVAYMKPAMLERSEFAMSGADDMCAASRIWSGSESLSHKTILTACE